MISYFYVLDEHTVMSIALWVLAMVVLLNTRTPKNMFILLGIFTVAISSILSAVNHSAGPMGLNFGMILFLLGKLQYSYKK